MYAVEPARHPESSQRQPGIDPPHSPRSRLDASRLSSAPFYKELSDAGVRCAIVDFPIDYLLPDFNGLQIVDWGTEFRLGKFGVNTPGFAAELDRKYGIHPLTHYDRTSVSLSDLLALKHKLLHGIDVKRRFAVDLLRRREHDFVFYNFAELHESGHFFWKFHDRKHPDFIDSEPQLQHAPFHRAAVGESAPLDWRKTRVYALPSVGNSHLRVNLAGREPLGVVTPGAEFQAVLAQTAAHLRELINPATGERAVEEIYFPSTRFHGPRSSELPDLAVVWNPNSPITALTSADLGTVSGKSTEGRTGNHRPDGFALFCGASWSARGPAMNGDPRQIAPTILEHFGVAKPAHYEGSSIALDKEGRSRAA